MEDVVKPRADDYRLQCLYVGRGHYLAAESCARKHRALGVPVVIGSTALASSIFTRMNESRNAVWSVAIGVAAAVIAALAALQTFLRFAEQAEAHKTAGVNYGMVRRQLELLALHYDVEDPSARASTVKELELVAGRLSDLAASSPHLSAKFYKRARREQSGAETTSSA